MRTAERPKPSCERQVWLRPARRHSRTRPRARSRLGGRSLRRCPQARIGLPRSARHTAPASAESRASPAAFRAGFDTRTEATARRESPPPATRIESPLGAHGPRSQRAISATSTATRGGPDQQWRIDEEEAGGGQRAGARLGCRRGRRPLRRSGSDPWDGFRNSVSVAGADRLRPSESQCPARHLKSRSHRRTRSAGWSCRAHHGTRWRR